MYETENWPFIKARWYHAVTTGRRPVRVVVIHDMEAPETSQTAENVAKYFATTDTQASAHICVDNNSIVQCVKDNDVAWAAPGANADGIQIEMAGYGNQTREQWLDFYGIGLLALVSDATAQYCLKYDLPVRHLTNAELQAGLKGIVGHYQVSAVYKQSSHTDPGLNFPWDDYFIPSVLNFYNARRKRV